VIVLEAAAAEQPAGTGPRPRRAVEGLREKKELLASFYWESRIGCEHRCKVFEINNGRHALIFPNKFGIR
jgi:hypothetical protein